MSRRLRAVLAGGLVLGLGFSVTMAAWTDTEVASGTFGASVFGTQSLVGGNPNWTDNNSTPAVLAFTAGGFSPTVAKYATLSIRTIPNSIAGTASLGGAVIGLDSDLAAGLRLRVVKYTTGTCSSDAFTAGAAFVVGNADTAAALTAGGAPQALTAAVGATPGTPITLCFQVSMPSGASTTLQGRTTTATWTVTTTSDS